MIRKVREWFGSWKKRQKTQQPKPFGRGFSAGVVSILALGSLIVMVALLGGFLDSQVVDQTGKLFRADRGLLAIIFLAGAVFGSGTIWVAQQLFRSSETVKQSRTKPTASSQPKPQSQQPPPHQQNRGGG